MKCTISWRPENVNFCARQFKAICYRWLWKRWFCSAKYYINSICILLLVIVYKVQSLWWTFNHNISVISFVCQIVVLYCLYEMKFYAIVDNIDKIMCRIFLSNPIVIKILLLSITTPFRPNVCYVLCVAFLVIAFISLFLLIGLDPPLLDNDFLS